MHLPPIVVGQTNTGAEGARAPNYFSWDESTQSFLRGRQERTTPAGLKPLDEQTLWAALLPQQVPVYNNRNSKKYDQCKQYDVQALILVDSKEEGMEV